MLWLRKGFGFAGAWTVCEQNQLLSVCFGLPELVKPETRTGSRPSCGLRQSLRQAPKKPPGPAHNDRTVGGLSMIRENREGAHRDGSTVALVLAPDW